MLPSNRYSESLSNPCLANTLPYPSRTRFSFCFSNLGNDYWFTSVRSCRVSASNEEGI